jgi:hypothetical protein
VRSTMVHQWIFFLFEKKSHARREPSLKLSDLIVLLDWQHRPALPLSVAC